MNPQPFDPAKFDLDRSSLLVALRREGALMAAAVASTGPDAAVPSCPRWVVRDLVLHTGGVHRWAMKHIVDASPTIIAENLADVAGPTPADSDLAEWLHEGVDALANTLATAPSDMVVGTFLAAVSPIGFWCRRQANETAIHRIDAELASGPAAAVTPSASVFAAQGVDELLRCFIVRPRGALRSPTTRRLGVVANDGPWSWTVTISDGPATTTLDVGADVDCQLTGSAFDLMARLWNRPSNGEIDIDGDRAVFDTFAALVTIGW